jgi:5-methylcytosine-specific restriction protein B
MGSFESAVEQFTYTEAERVKEETLRQQFLERFPASNIPSMTLEQYSLGLEPTESSFCYWLEYKTSELGSIKGGNAKKYVIYFGKESNSFEFPPEYGTKEQAFEVVKSGILKLLELARSDQLEQCEAVPPFETLNLVRGKILNMYFPEKFLPIFSLDHLKDLCLQFGVHANFESQISMNLALLSFKLENPLVSGWSNDKFASFIYEKYPPTVQFWKVAPGEKARLWPDCLHGSFMCVGWSKIGDMRQYADRDAFSEMYRGLHPVPGSFKQWKEIWGFAKEIKRGDIIVANNGLSEIVGVGTCTGDYYYEQNRAEYKHCLPVHWETMPRFSVPEAARTITARWFSGTVKRLGRDEYQRLIAGVSGGDAPMVNAGASDAPQVSVVSSYAAVCKETCLPEAFFADCERLLGTKKQVILQGAPGTGKTFVAEKLAALWAGDGDRVKVVQFHESFGYEDFVYGIKPRVGADGKTAFCPEPGVFLRFCKTVRDDPEENYVLLIDEINRAKTSRVFGELLYLLEYREQKVELQSGTEFSIPDNLYIIGTMNTTDKSIALVDYALRRRFAFVDLVPVKNGKSVVLRKWLNAKGIINAAEVDALFVALNNAIAQKDEALMVGHSYFMQKQAVDEKHFSDDLLRFLWEYYILPLIAEYEYQLSRSDLEARYDLEALRSVARANLETVS